MKLINPVFVMFLLLGLSSCAGGPRSESLGEALDSAAITTKVKTRLLQDEVVSGTDINVDTFKTSVLLSGFVRSQQEKERAEEIAARVQGVREVRNTLIVRGE